MSSSSWVKLKLYWVHIKHACTLTLDKIESLFSEENFSCLFLRRSVCLGVLQISHDMSTYILKFVYFASSSVLISVSFKSSGNFSTDVVCCLFLILSVSFMGFHLEGLWNFSFYTISLFIYFIFSPFFTFLFHPLECKLY